MRSTKFIVGAVLLLGAHAPVAAAQDVPWPGRIGRYVFDVTRNGSSIRTQVVEIKQQGDTLIATTESTIAVKLLGLVVYRMHQMLTETYEDGRLIAVSGESVDGDGKRVAEVKRDGDHWTGSYNKEKRAFDCDCTATPMWNIASTRASNMVEASEGRLRHVTVVDEGTEMLDLPEGKVKTQHFTVRGEIQRDVWYDAAGNLVAATQLGRDGSRIHQTLISDPAGSSVSAPEAAESPAP
jgi:hypothetical protein